MKRILAPLCVLFFLLPITAFSQGYMSAAYGTSDVDFNIPDFDFDYAESFFDDADSWTIAGGYKVNDLFAIEGSYVDFGKWKLKGIDVPVAFWIKGDAFDIGLVGIWPVSEDFKLFVRAGYMQWDAEVRLDVDTEKADGHDYNFGIGAEYSFNDRFSLFADYKRFQINIDEDLGGDEIKVNTISLGAKVYFQ